jgi:hypothetical protein
MWIWRISGWLVKAGRFMIWLSIVVCPRVMANCSGPGEASCADAARLARTTRMAVQMQLTLREMSRVRVPVMIWLTLSAVAAVAGPFGTLDVMAPGMRALYWSVVVGASVALSFGADRLARTRSRAGAVAVWAGFVVVLSAGVHLANSLIFSGWGGAADLAYLAGSVALVTAGVRLLIWGIAPAPTAPEAKPQETFQRRLPFGLRAPLVRIEA